MRNKKIFINNREISLEVPPYIIGEISANHNGSIENVYKLIDVAKKSGASAVKIQTYTADTITADCRSKDFMIDGGLWDGRSLYDLYSEASLPWDWHKSIFNYAAKKDLTIFSSPFDASAVDLLEDLNAPAYKIASFEAIDIPLIKYTASTKKPMIISTGMTTTDEIEEAVNAALVSGCKDLILLHCVSSYPAHSIDYNLKTILDMQSRYKVMVGLSDHTVDNTTAIASVALGATVIEKHITLNRDGGGPDDSFSLEPADLEELCHKTLTAWESLGSADYKRSSSEIENKQFRRSIYFMQDKKVGQIIEEKDVRVIRPGYGLKPKYLEEVIGKKISQDVGKFTPVSWGVIE
ncbi:pseudaminic acid synthase [Gammaproteobacteria bacterium]|jgi:pseudaminic acid synthase|nr:pseudaminic acid synthase [Gammaproteobacteria bacterium]